MRYKRKTELYDGDGQRMCVARAKKENLSKCEAH